MLSIYDLCCCEVFRPLKTWKFCLDDKTTANRIYLGWLLYKLDFPGTINLYQSLYWVNVIVPVLHRPICSKACGISFILFIDGSVMQRNSYLSVLISFFLIDHLRFVDLLSYKTEMSKGIKIRNSECHVSTSPICTAFSSKIQQDFGN